MSKKMQTRQIRAFSRVHLYVGVGGKKAVRTQEREKMNVEEGQKRFSAPHVLRAHP